MPYFKDLIIRDIDAEFVKANLYYINDIIQHLNHNDDSKIITIKEHLMFAMEAINNAHE